MSHAILKPSWCTVNHYSVLEEIISYSFNDKYYPYQKKAAMIERKTVYITIYPYAETEDWGYKKIAVNGSCHVHFVLPFKLQILLIRFFFHLVFFDHFSGHSLFTFLKHFASTTFTVNSIHQSTRYDRTIIGKELLIHTVASRASCKQG